MRILLVGNYANCRQQSMQRYGTLVRDGLQAVGYSVRLVRPPVILGRLWPGASGVGKWVGYFDRFILYPALLRWQARWADVVHICDQTNAVYVPHLGKKPHVITCHDMLAIRAALGEIAGLRTRLTGRVYQRWILANLRKAQHIVCVTQETRADVERVAGVPTGRISVTPNALNYAYCPMDAKKAALKIREIEGRDLGPYFVHVGGNQWYKNRLGVLRIFAELVKTSEYKRHYLIMVGKPLSREAQELVSSLGLSRRVVVHIDVPAETLRAIYSAADALLFPSLYEGFGWPIVEAQACGCPVITTKRAPMTTVSGGAAILINPADGAGAAARICSGLRERKDLVKAGFQNSIRYSAASMIDGYAREYVAVLNGADSGERC